MPAVSKKQRRAAAIALKHPEKAKGASKEMAKSMKKSDLEKFAKTKEKNLPEDVSLDGDILTESQKTELQKIIDVLVEERVQQRIKKFSDKYTKFIVESATKKIVSKVKTGLATKINEELDIMRQKTENICRSAVLEASSKISTTKKAQKQLVEEFKRTAPNLIKKLSEEKANELSREAMVAIEENKRLTESLSGIMKGIGKAGFVINEDVDSAVQKERNEKLMLRTKLVETRRDLKVEQLTEGMLPNQKKEIIKLLEDCTTEKMVEDRFLLAKSKVMNSNTHIEEETPKIKPEVQNMVEEEEMFGDFLSAVKGY